jgi:hypothetical protein
MHRTVANLIAAVERSEHGYADVPPDSINDEIESELAAYGYAVALSDRLWIGGIGFTHQSPFKPGTIDFTSRHPISLA